MTEEGGQGHHCWKQILKNKDWNLPKCILTSHRASGRMSSGQMRRNCQVSLVFTKHNFKKKRLAVKHGGLLGSGVNCCMCVQVCSPGGRPVEPAEVSLSYRKRLIAHKVVRQHVHIIKNIYSLTSVEPKSKISYSFPFYFYQFQVSSVTFVFL